MKAARFVSLARPERPRLAGPAMLLAMAAAMSASLLAVFPAQSLENRLATTGEVDPVSLAYLRSWLRAKPDDYYLRLVLARQELHKGDLDMVETTLRPLLQAVDVNSDEHNDAQMLLLETRQQQLWRTQPGAPGFAAVRLAYLIQLREVASHDWPDARLKQYADTAFTLGDAALGSELYLRIIKSNPAAHFDMVDRVVQMDVGSGKYREAAALSFWVLPYIHDVGQQRHYFLGGLQILVSGNQVSEAVDASEAKIGALTDDPQTLTYVVHLALSGQRPDVAARFMAHLLQQHVAFGEERG